MNIEQMVEKLRSEMPNGLTEIEMAKYIYIELGKMKSYDEKYYFGNRKTKEKIYRLSKSTPYRLDETMKRKKLICTSLSYLYLEILKRFNIDAEVYKQYKKDPHIYILIHFENGRTIKADIQLDLPFIQTGMKTRNFGYKQWDEFDEPYSELSEEENIEIDKKINYIEKEEDYRDESIERVKTKCKSKSPIECGHIIINDKSVNDIPSDMGYVDRNRYYINLFRMCIPRKYFDIVHCYRYGKNEDGEEEKIYKTILSIYGKKGSQSLYTFSENNNKFIPILPEILKQINFEENRKEDSLDTVYWSKNGNYSGARKILHVIKQNEKDKNEKISR